MKKKIESYSFKPSLEQLLELRHLSAKEKLQWLEDANKFISKFYTPEKIEKWKKLTGRN